MQIHMTFKHMDATESLKSAVNSRSDKLKRFLATDAELHWVFYLEADTHVADLRIQAPHLDLFAQSKTDDLYESIEEVSDKIEKLLIKNKEITKDHLHRKR